MDHTPHEALVEFRFKARHTYMCVLLTSSTAGLGVTEMWFCISTLHWDD